MDFQSLDKFVDGRGAREQRRNDDDGTELTRNTIAKFEPREHRWAEPICNESVHQGDCAIYRNEDPKKCQRQKNPSNGAGHFDCEQSQSKKKPSCENHGPEITYDPHCRIRTN